jgi:DMSO/TMAO reductase YedYZ heme-binding membrane subunit
MTARSWKQLQRFAYLFFILIFLHLSGYLLYPALQGSQSALLNLTVYLVILVAYIILRVRREYLDSKARNRETGMAE